MINAHLQKIGNDGMFREYSINIFRNGLNCYLIYIQEYTGIRYINIDFEIYVFNNILQCCPKKYIKYVEKYDILNMINKNVFTKHVKNTINKNQSSIDKYIKQ